MDQTAAHWLSAWETIAILGLAAALGVLAGLVVPPAAELWRQRKFDRDLISDREGEQ